MCPPILYAYVPYSIRFKHAFEHPVPGGFHIHNCTYSTCIVCYWYFPTQNPCSQLVPYNTSSFWHRHSFTGHSAGQLKIGGSQVNHSFYWAGVFYIIAEVSEYRTGERRNDDGLGKSQYLPTAYTFIDR